MNQARAIIERDITDKQLFLSARGRAIVATNIQTVANDAARASAALHSSFGISILGHVPYLSDQSNGILELVSDVSVTASTGSALLRQVDELASQSQGTTVSLAGLQSLQASISRAKITLAGQDRPAGDLIGPLGTARRQFDQELGKITTDLNRGSQTISYALPFLGSDGARSYLVAGENNAEMRDQGDVLSVGLLTTDNGTFDLNNTESVDDIEPSTPVSVPIPADTQLVFEHDFGLTQLWQSVNPQANFPLSAELMQAMYQQANGTHVDGVVALDVPALASLLALTGPVSVPNIPGLITAQNVGEVLLHEQYLQYPVASLSAERHDNIAAVARAAVRLLKTEHVDLAALGNALAADVSGRHLMVWDENSGYEKILSNLGISGAVDTVQPKRTFHIAVENATATKLDYYVETSISAHVQITPNGDAFITTSVTISNTCPAGLGPSFQIGPDDVNSTIPGQYVTRVEFWSPRGSIDPSSVPESGLELSQISASVLPQQSKSVTFSDVIQHAVVGGRFDLRFVPQPRLVPSQLKIEISAPGWKLRGPTHLEQPLSGTTVFAWQVAK
jgi:hypothetical protein